MHGQHSAGFTLLELIVVIAIFAVFSLMAYGGLDSVLKTRGRVEEALARTAAMQKAYLKLRNDLQQLRNRPTRDGYGDPQPPIKLDDRSRDARLEFTRGGWRNPLFQPRPALERVAYRIDDGKLIRESFRVLDQAQGSEPVKLILLEGVDELEWRFLDGAREWRTRWPPDDTVGQPQQPAGSVPLGIELKLRTKAWGELTFLFRPGVDPAQIPPIADAGGRGGPGEDGANKPGGAPNDGICSPQDPVDSPDCDREEEPPPGEEPEE